MNDGIRRPRTHADDLQPSFSSRRNLTFTVLAAEGPLRAGLAMQLRTEVRDARPDTEVGRQEGRVVSKSASKCF